MKAGLEVHQQLATGKLFCDCPAELSEVVTTRFRRRLRATGGENHAIDPAAAAQAARGLQYLYEATTSNCLVELDEEPPHGLNREAVEVALTMALLLKARPVSEIQVMRKIVVDGSNTSGFQRTALVAVDGELELGGHRYGIQSICLEEDAARKVGEAHGQVSYRLDRLGIPLIEIATAPEITSGAEAREVAEELGTLLRSTRRVRRGIGTIREDLNVSTKGGARVEIKGVQDLRLLERFVAGEEERQLHLLRVRDELRVRHARIPVGPPVEVTHLIDPSGKGGLAETVRKGGVVLGLRFEGFAGLFRSPEGGNERLGRELADYARSTGLKGLLHSDELPGYGIDQDAVPHLRSELGVGEKDGFVLVAADEARRAERALSLVLERAAMALDRIPEETRDPQPDGRTRYSRPLPGRDRMYPETDVPPVPVGDEWIARIQANLPEHPEALRQRLAREHSLSLPVVSQLQRSGDLDRFEELVRAGHSAAGVARLLTQDLPAVEETLGDGPHAELSSPTLDGVLGAVDRGEFAKEGIPTVLAELYRGAKTVPDAISAAGFESMTREDLAKLAGQLVLRNEEMIRSKGPAAFSPLMGDLMQAVRGRRDGKEVAAVLRAALEGHGATTHPP